MFCFLFLIFVLKILSWSQFFLNLRFSPIGITTVYLYDILQHLAQMPQKPSLVGFSSVQSLSRVRIFATPWIAARQASLSITNSRSSLRLMSIEPVMPSSHLILCHTLLLLPPLPPIIRVFSNESTLHMRWPKYWEFQLRLAQGLRKVKFRWNWVLSWQQKILKETSF